jgi:hypothetical protein
MVPQAHVLVEAFNTDRMSSPYNNAASYETNHTNNGWDKSNENGEDNAGK